MNKSDKRFFYWMWVTSVNFVNICIWPFSWGTYLSIVGVALGLFYMWFQAFKED